MALIKCSECGNEVSEKAAACPKYGNPVAANFEKEVRTIQQTAKKYKGTQVICFFLIIIGLFVTIANQQNSTSVIGVLMMVVGVIGTIMARFLSWWNHG